MSILDLIDNVVDEHDLVSADAMRWAPDAPDPTSPALTATRLAAICDIPPELIDGDPLTLGTARLSRMHSPVPPQEEEPMMLITRDEVETLGRYNAEVSRGVAHTPEYAARMADLQRRFDRRMTELDGAIDDAGLMLEVLRRSALPRWLSWLILLVGVGFLVYYLTLWIVGVLR